MKAACEIYEKTNFNDIETYSYIGLSASFKFVSYQIRKLRTEKTNISIILDLLYDDTQLKFFTKKLINHLLYKELFYFFEYLKNNDILKVGNDNFKLFEYTDIKEISLYLQNLITHIKTHLDKDSNNKMKVQPYSKEMNKLVDSSDENFQLIITFYEKLSSNLEDLKFKMSRAIFVNDIENAKKIQTADNITLSQDSMSLDFSFMKIYENYPDEFTNVNYMLIEFFHLMIRAYKKDLFDINIIDDFGPMSLLTFQNNNNDKCDEKYPNLEFFQLPIKEDEVIFINEIENLSIINEKFKDSEFIGFDSEWKQKLNPLDKDLSPSILQLSDGKNCIIIDYALLKNKINFEDEIIKSLKNKIFIGYNIKYDIKILSEKLKSFFNNSNIIELENYSPPNFNNYSDKGYKKMIGLSNLTEIILRKKLCKHYQLSNWEIRPLKKSQLHYAAADAYVVVEIFKELQKKKGKILL